MNTFQIKILAALLMVVDHVGYFLYPDISILRIIGRLSFPLFAFLIVQGYKYTSDFKKFFLRLFIFANIIQIPGLWQTIPVNIFYTLSLGLLLIHTYEMNTYKINKFVFTLGISALTLFINPDYSLYGVLLILCIHLFKDKWLQLAIAFFVLGIFFYGSHIQLYAVLSIPIMMLYNNKLGYKIKWFFYIFYPTHIGILYAIGERMR